MHDPASVLTLHRLATGQRLQCLGRHLREMKVTVKPGSNSTFNMVRDRTANMVSHTMMLNGMSLFLLGILAMTLSELSLASRSASNTAKASSTVGFPVGILLVTLDLGKGNAFPAVKVGGLLLTFTAGMACQMLRGS